MSATENPPVEDSSLQPVVTVEKFSDYLFRLVQLLDNGDKADDGLKAKLKERSSVEILKQFIADPQASSLMVERLSNKGKSLSF